MIKPAQSYAAMHRQSLDDPEAFWGEAAKLIDWFQPWDQLLSLDERGMARWFVGGETNACWNALDRHAHTARATQTALIYDSPVTATVRHFSYAELTDIVARVAGMLQRFGVARGDRVLIYMPAIPEAIASMLACARIGAIHSVVFGGFAARELATRIQDAQPKLILAASCGIEPNRLVAYKPAIDEALDIAGGSVTDVIVLQRPQLTAALQQGRDHDWAAAFAAAEPVGCVPVPATDPLYILYTSGTTGAPKGIVRPSGGQMVALAWSMRHVYNMQPGEVYWAASDIGWAVGHSYITYAPLYAGCTTLLYEGKPVGTPDAGAFWRVIEQHRVTTLFTAPTAIRAIKREDPEGLLLRGHDTSSLKALFLAGERCDPPTSEWIEAMLDRPVVDHWWQTETGWPICANPLGIEQFPTKHGSVTKPLPGWDVQVLDSAGTILPANRMGTIACKLPLPPGVATTLWNAPERYAASYLAAYPGYYFTGDAGYIDDDGYLRVMTRTDDVINVAGHRLSTGAIEEVLARHPDIAECAVIGLNDDLKGQVPLGLLVTKSAVRRPAEDIVRESIALVRDTMGAVVAFKTALVVQRLPKTRSGKVLRGTIAKIANGDPFTQPATIEDPAALTEIAASLSVLRSASGKADQ